VSTQLCQDRHLQERQFISNKKKKCVNINCNMNKEYVYGPGPMLNIGMGTLRPLSMSSPMPSSWALPLSSRKWRKSRQSRLAHSWGSGTSSPCGMLSNCNGARQRENAPLCPPPIWRRATSLPAPDLAPATSGTSLLWPAALRAAGMVRPFAHGRTVGVRAAEPTDSHARKQEVGRTYVHSYPFPGGRAPPSTVT